MENLGGKKINFQEVSLHLEMEERLMKVPSRRRIHVPIESFTAHKKLDDIQRLKLRVEFLSNVISRIQIF